MIRLTREVRFSVDRDWAGRVDPARPVTNSWGGWPSAVGITPYLVLRGVVSGEPDPLTGYLCNIAEIDGLLRREGIPRIAAALADSGWRIGPEQMLLALWEPIRAAAPPGAQMESLELWTTPMLRVAMDRRRPQMVTLTQQFEFSAAHRLHCPALSDAENRAIFGKCNNPNGHGHNYVVEVSVRGAPDASGVLLPLPRFEALVKQLVIDELDHKHLNVDTQAFAQVNPSVENIAHVIWQMLDGHLAPAALANVRVYETPKTWADFSG